MAGWKIPTVNRECIFKRPIFQPAMLVYQRVDDVPAVLFGGGTPIFVETPHIAQNAVVG